ncbi:MAG: phosphate signaling complex protein PhoU [Bdellovibrionales bacterium]|nr:phosphate signaling complex protein PhoU [Bdellovibrionales bacterium]
MSKPLQRSLQQIKRSLLSLATVVEEQCRDALRSFHHSDEQLADIVIERDNEVDLMEVDIEEDCLKILALYQPVAFDLRFVVAVLKINNDLERIGDLALNIAERAVALSSKKLPETTTQLESMGEIVIAMVKRCIDALINRDIELARQILAMDVKVDDLHREHFETIKEAIIAYPVHALDFIQLLSISRYLERIGDQTTNIAEDVIYLVEGEIVRHRHSETGYNGALGVEI